MQYTRLIFTRKGRDILSVASTDPIKYQLIDIYVKMWFSNGYYVFKRKTKACYCKRNYFIEHRVYIVIVHQNFIFYLFAHNHVIWFYDWQHTKLYWIPSTNWRRNNLTLLHMIYIYFLQSYWHNRLYS